jgi:HD superfamily phosphodiesterase
MDIIERVKEIVKPQYDALECWVHSWQHVEDVVKNAKKLAELEGVNSIPCIIAAYCHDLGRIEEEARKKRGDSPLPHALLSIEPTMKVLQQIGISGVKFNEIIEAVAVHSYRIYEGDNNIAKVLQDADKIGSGFGPYRILTIIKYYGGKDYVNVEEIVNNKNNPKKLQELCDISLKQLECPALEQIKRGINFVLEWFDMFNTKSAQILIKPEEYEYFLQIKSLLEKRN